MGIALRGSVPGPLGLPGHLQGNARRPPRNSVNILLGESFHPLGQLPHNIQMSWGTRRIPQEVLVGRNPARSRNDTGSGMDPKQKGPEPRLGMEAVGSAAE